MLLSFFCVGVGWRGWGGPKRSLVPMSIMLIFLISRHPVLTFLDVRRFEPFPPPQNPASPHTTSVRLLKAPRYSDLAGAHWARTPKIAHHGAGNSQIWPAHFSDELLAQSWRQDRTFIGLNLFKSAQCPLLFFFLFFFHSRLALSHHSCNLDRRPWSLPLQIIRFLPFRKVTSVRASKSAICDAAQPGGRGVGF